ncbi:hypothetical protein JVT61DRAFT_14709 [Boletus reticuloceps]|uniref:Uncharacterized protein n=1 Tax=Boletus reticuloceps TaxID=495285 RepID=A0A8I2YSW2_9AGAM|nr:hypothetical protein JVT61DRAFT_14709 [Boletus reticuloceps]
MATRYAPPAIPPPETGTPPREWSEAVLASSSPASDTPATFSEIKGGADHPRMTEEQSRESHVSKEEGKQKAQPSSESQTTVAQTVKQYMPEQVGKAADYTVQTAASYLPDFQGSYLSPEEHQEKPHVSLPSTESKGAQPSEYSGGVGALPGNLSESSVALLPDERQERAQERQSTSPRQRRDTIKPSAVGEAEEPGASEKAEATMPRDVALFEDEPVTSQPSDAPPKSTEAGTVEAVESDIADTSGPEVESQKGASEAKSQQAQSEQEKANTGPRAEELGEKTGPEKDVEGSNLGSEEPVQGKGPSQDAQEEEFKEGKPAPAGFKPGYSGNYHPAQLHPPPPGASATEFQGSLGSQPAEPEPVTQTGRRESLSAEKKPGFMTMVKGEMKILAGKVSGDEHKVEEGKKIVHGDA